jgi:hypothetical protein
MDALTSVKSPELMADIAIMSSAAFPNVTFNNEPMLEP